MSQRILIDGAEVGGVVDTDIVQRPAILNGNGEVLICTPEMESLPVDQLKLMAKLAKGRLAWRKYRVTYEEVISKVSKSHAICDYNQCYALVQEDSDFCNDQHQTLAGM